MQYRVDPKTGNQLSILGYGCMRFAKKGTSIDQEKAESLLLRAMEEGVNYFDTAYIYPGSEVALGKFLAKAGRREKAYVATKLPHYLVNTLRDADRMFDEELHRLQTDYIDYYLMHMLTDIGAWERLCAMGIEEWIAARKASGAIRSIGFSFHGGTEQFLKILEAYPWDFCQIQYNYMDEYAQAGVAGLRRAAELGILVVIMEPLRGGRLVNQLSAEAKRLLGDAPVQRSAAEWALRWIWNQKEPGVVLSGMNADDQLEENLRIASEVEIGALTEADFAMFDALRSAINRSVKVGCTGCGYCMPCPFGVDIPTCLRAYNVRYTDGLWNGMREYMMCTTLRATPSNASLCRACGKCEAHCPQSIPIREELRNTVRTLETPLYKIAARVAKLFTKF